jgi:hypothetical protein
MLEPLPARSVARFMLPLADVMTVLFSLFLLLPHLEQRGTSRSSAGGKTGIWTAAEQLEAREELTRFHRIQQTPTSQRLMIVVLTIDGENGNLLVQEGAQQKPLAGVGEVDALIRRHLELARTANKELFYVLQAPAPGQVRRHPTLGDEANYRAWFGQRKVQFQVTGL